jgi:hypothetical protein
MISDGNMAAIMGYLDPGTGSWIVQTLIAGAIGAMYGVKVFWFNIVSGMSRLFGRNRDESSSD